MSAPDIFQRDEGKRRRPHKAERHDARKFIMPIRAQIREAFTNTGDSEQVSRHFDSTIRSTIDVVLAGHDAAIEDQGQRLAAIERRLGMGQATNANVRLELIARRVG